MPMNQIINWATAFEELQQQILDLVDQLSEAQWTWSPSPKDWSAARCIDHINTVNGLVVPRLAEAIRRGREMNLTGEGPFRYPLFDRLFVFALEPRAPVKQSAPGIYLPDQQPEREAVRRRFCELQPRLIECVHAAEGLHMVRVKAPSPVNRLLRFSLGTWFSAMAAHEEKHFEQAQRLTREPGFPTGS